MSHLILSPLSEFTVFFSAQLTENRNCCTDKSWRMDGMFGELVVIPGHSIPRPWKVSNMKCMSRVKNTPVSPLLYWPNNRWILENLGKTFPQVLKSKMQKADIFHVTLQNAPQRSFKSTSSTLGSFSKLGTHTAKTSWNSSDESSFISDKNGRRSSDSEFVQKYSNNFTRLKS